MMVISKSRQGSQFFYIHIFFRQLSNSHSQTKDKYSILFLCNQNYLLVNNFSHIHSHKKFHTQKSMPLCFLPCVRTFFFYSDVGDLSFPILSSVPSLRRNKQNRTKTKNDKKNCSMVTPQFQYISLFFSFKNKNVIFLISCHILLAYQYVSSNCSIQRQQTPKRLGIRLQSKNCK